MLTKAIIESVQSSTEVRVRIPLVDSIIGQSQATPTEFLSSAIISVMPGCQFVPEIGDIVLVGFEDSDVSKPLILGCLQKSSPSASTLNATINNLIVTGSANFNGTVTLGNISYQELSYLKGLRMNLQNTINSFEARISQLEDNVQG